MAKEVKLENPMLEFVNVKIPADPVLKKEIGRAHV